MDIKWIRPCYPGSNSLPPVFCRSYTGRRWAAGLKIDDIRPQFLDDFAGHLDAPSYLPAGSHHSPYITINGKPSMERAHTIYAVEIMRGGA